MFRDEQVSSETDWMCEATAASSACPREIDRALRRIAKLRSDLDAEEARWLRLADEQKVWPKLGYVHALEYLEDVFGYAPRSSQERLRVARELGELPKLETALEDGAMTWSVARELTRVATPDTEDRWLAAAAGKNLREVERLVAGHDKGDDPDDPPDPDLLLQVVSVRLSPSTVALLRQVRAMLDDERGEQLDDDAAYEAICRRVLEVGAVSRHGDSPGTAGPSRMIHVTTCRSCERATQNGSGATFDLAAAERELALCDAVVCDDERGTRATHTIPPVTRRTVMQRDQACCRVPGCRSARNLDVHHMRPRAHGGGHEPANLAVLCSGHHRLLHEGVLSATGDANQQLTFIRDGKVLCESRVTVPRPSSPARVRPMPPVASVAATAACLTDASNTSPHVDGECQTLAKIALHQLGFKLSVAKQAVSIAKTRVPPGADVEVLIREALRHCK